MKLRNRMIQDRPRIEVPEEEEGEDISSTAPQVGSPLSTRTRSASANDSQEQPLTPILESHSSFTRGQLAHYLQFSFHEDFILYSHSDTDDGIGEEQGTSANFLSPHPPRSYRNIAPCPEPQTIHATSSSSSSTQARTQLQNTVTTQRQLPSMHIPLPESSQMDDSMMSHFENQPGPWSTSSPVNAEGRKRALSDEIPDIRQYPKDRHWDDKMQEDLKKIGTPEGQEESDNERSRRAKRRRREKKRTSTTPSKSRKNDDKHQKDSDGRGSGQGGGQAVMAS